MHNDNGLPLWLYLHILFAALLLIGFVETPH